MAQKVGRREKLAQKVGRREIYPLFPPSRSADRATVCSFSPDTLDQSKRTVHMHNGISPCYWSFQPFSRALCVNIVLVVKISTMQL